jgi:hypothetical protein
MRWEGDDTIIADFNQAWTWEDFYATVRQMHAEITLKAHTVHMVIVHGAPFPAGNPLRNFQAAIKDQPRNVGQVIVVPHEIASPFQSFMLALVSVVEKINPTKGKIRMVRSLDEARQLIARARASA